MPLVGDPLPYGMKANIASIEAMLTYGLQQKLIPSACRTRRGFRRSRLKSNLNVEERRMPSIVDIHPHVISPDTKRYPLNPLGGTQSTWSRDRPTPYEALVRRWTRPASPRPRSCRPRPLMVTTTLYVADAVAAYPKRFTGVFSVDVLAADAVENMTHWLGKGFSGMRLFTTGSTMPGQATWFDDPRRFRPGSTRGKAGIPVCMQMTPQGFPQLRGLLDRFTKVPIILDHLARSRSRTARRSPPRPSSSSSRNTNVFLKLTPINVTPRLGQGHAGNVLRHDDRYLWRGPHRLGLELPATRSER